MKTKICGAVAGISFLLFLGTVGAMENGIVDAWVGVARCLVFLAIMSVSLRVGEMLE